MKKVKMLLKIQVAIFRNECDVSYFRYLIRTLLVMVSILTISFLTACANNQKTEMLHTSSLEFMDMNELINEPFKETIYLNRVSFSFDGSMMAALGERMQEDESGGRLYIFDLEKPMVIFDGEKVAGWRTLAMSPKGNRIAICGQTSQGDGIHLIELENNAIEYLTNGCYPAWSSDGKQLAYVYYSMLQSDPNRRIQIRIMDLVTKDDYVIFDILSPNGYIVDLNWSPVNDQIAFLANFELKNQNSNLYTINMDTNDIRMLTNANIDVTSANFSPDGKKLLYIDKTYSFQNGSFLQVSALNGDCHRLDPPFSDLRNVTLSSNGEVVAMGTQNELLVGKPNVLLGENFWDIGIDCAK